MTEFVRSPYPGETISQAGARYRCSEGLHWVVERRGILFVSPDRGAICTLLYPAAAVWDLISRGYPLAQVARMVSYIAGVSQHDAEEVVASSLETMRQTGLLTGE